MNFRSGTQSSSTRSIERLVRGLFDYAGLFPPAQLSLTAAATSFVRYAQGAHAWMLGRFVVLSSQLPELVEQLGSLGLSKPVDTSVLSSDWVSEREQVIAFVNEHSSLLQIGAIEQKWKERLPLPGAQPVYVETSL
ncbi:MAG: hypothetical protein VB878_00590, partial [Pirellulaceae bacterium]